MLISEYIFVYNLCVQKTEPRTNRSQYVVVVAIVVSMAVVVSPRGVHERNAEQRTGTPGYAQ